MQGNRQRGTEKFLVALGCESWTSLVGRVFVVCICIAYFLIPFGIAKDLVGIRAFLSRATAHAWATTQDSSSYRDYGSSYGGGMAISTSSCDETVTFHTSTGQSVTFHASDSTNFVSLPCYQDSVLVLYNPQHPSDARISDDIAPEMKVDILELVVLLGVPLGPFLLLPLGALLRWIDRLRIAKGDETKVNGTS